MKFLAFTDVHEDKAALACLAERAKEPDIDFVVTTGDISTFGRGLPDVFATFGKTGKKLYFIPGNHEEGIDFTELLQKHPLCINLHCVALPVGDYLFLGYGGGGFAQEDSHFRKIAREWYGLYKGKKIIFLTHGPPYDTAVDVIQERHVGNIDYRQFIERIKPKVAVCGHLHETVGVVDTIGETKIVNPGWDGMIIELK